LLPPRVDVELLKSALMTLGDFACPLIFEKRLPSFPSLNSDDGDEFNAAVVIHDSGITRERWAEIVELATELLELPFSQRAITAISSQLLERGALPGREIKQLVDEASSKNRERSA
jgi:hypothetical protein